MFDFLFVFLLEVTEQVYTRETAVERVNRRCRRDRIEYDLLIHHL